MYGHDSKPSKIYTYGANAPIAHGDLAIQQLRLANIYHNKLVELERNRRIRVRAELRKISPQLAQLDQDIELAEEELEAARAERKRQHVQNRARKCDADIAERLRTISQSLTEKRKQVKELSGKLYESARWKKIQSDIDEDIKEQRKKLREHCGVFWGTYLTVEQALGKCRKGPRPRFKSFTGEGRIAVQLQTKNKKDKKTGVVTERVTYKFADIVAGKSQYLKVEVMSAGVWAQGARKPRKLGTAIAHIMIGKKRVEVVGDAGKKKLVWEPIYLKIPFHMHREIPADAEIKWAWAVRRKVGTKFEWQMQFVLSRDTWPREDAARKGTVGLDVGWRRLDDGSLRVATWSGSDGQSGQLTLSESWVRQMLKVDDIRAIRDKLFNEARDALVAAVKGNPATITWVETWARRKDVELRVNPETGKTRKVTWAGAKVEPYEIAGLKQTPAALLALLSSRPDANGKTHYSLPTWRAPAKLAWAILKWRECRFPGDEEVFAAMEAWRKRDKHLYEYEAHLREQLQLQRADIYRKFAASMRRSYAKIGIEGSMGKDGDAGRPMDLRKFHVLPKPESDGRKLGCGSIREACLSLLRRFLEETMCVETVPSAGTSKTCSACGVKNTLDHSVTFTCDGCGKVWDRDVNAARNILNRAGIKTQQPKAAKPKAVKHASRKVLSA